MSAVAIRPAGLQVSIRRDDCLRFLRSLPDASVDVITTDPAYSGMNQHLMLGRGRIVGRYQDAGSKDSKWFTEFHDDPENYRVFLQECQRVLRDDRHVYVMFDSFSLLTLGGIVREVFDVKNIITWDKVNLGMGHYFRRQHELILFATKGHRKLSRRDMPDVWSVKRIYKAAYPTQKPVEVFTLMLKGSVEPGFVVCDPFVGSGSAAIAALRAGCSFVGADISDKAVAISNERCTQFLETGFDPLEPKSAPSTLRLHAATP